MVSQPGGTFVTLLGSHNKGKATVVVEEIPESDTKSQTDSIEEYVFEALAYIHVCIVVLSKNTTFIVIIRNLLPMISTIKFKYRYI